MERAVVEADGRIRIPDGIRDAAHLEPGQELEIAYAPGQVMIFNGEIEQSQLYSTEFLAGLDEALEEARTGRGTFYASTEEFLAALEARDSQP